MHNFIRKDLDRNIHDYIKLLSKLKTVPGRMQEVASKNGAKIFVDFAHTPDALKTF